MMMASTTEQYRTMPEFNSFEERHGERSSLMLRERYKWRILMSTTVINVIIAGVLPSLGILLYFDLQDREVSLRAAIRTPIYFIISWCIADSWSQTVYTTTSFKKFAVAGSIVAALSIGVNFTFHDTLAFVGSHYLLGIMAGSGARLLMTISENIFSEYFSTKSSWVIGFSSLVIHSLGFILVPLLVTCIAETEGIHYAILMLSVLALQTLPLVILLRKPRKMHSSKRLYLTNQPAYALLHNEIDESDDQSEEAETTLSQPNSTEISTRQHAGKNCQNVGLKPGNVLQERNETPGRNTETADGIAIPLFTDVELVAGTYQGEVAYSFEDTMMSESPRHDKSELFFQGLARRRANDQSRKLRCWIVPSLHREMNPFKHPALYLGLISMLAQKAVTIMVWILLPTLIGRLPHAHGHVAEVSLEVGAAFVSVVTGLASTPVILIPFTFNSFSLKGRKFTHGACTVITSVFIYGVGVRLPEIHIGVLAFFGLSNVISVGTLEPLLKKLLLGNDHFKGHKTQQEEWGKIRGLANTVVGLIILLATIAIDLLIKDWNSEYWPLLFYMAATLQLFAGIIWIITPLLHCHHS